MTVADAKAAISGCIAAIGNTTSMTSDVLRDLTDALTMVSAAATGTQHQLVINALTYMNAAVQEAHLVTRRLASARDHAEKYVQVLG